MNENCCCGSGDAPCGCCEGIEKITPQKIANRPGLKALSYRVGTHATFLETMLARISELVLEARDDSGAGKPNSLMPLRPLKTREQDDAAIAWLDSWATVADVLTFYQERIANEGFLRTATERRSLLELARLVGYKLRPGVAATVYLAFELEKDQNVTIPKGIRAQSIPGPGEMPQAFEASYPVEARFIWNAIKPRLTRPQAILWDSNKNQIVNAYEERRTEFFFQGITTNLRPNDPLLFVFDKKQVLHFVDTVEVQTEKDRTKVTRQLLFVDYQLLVEETIAAYLRVQDFGLQPDDPVVQKVELILASLSSAVHDLASDSTTSEIAEEVQAKLPNLIEAYKTLPETTTVQVKSWFKQIIDTLNEILFRLSGASKEGVAGVAAFEKLKSLVAPLLKPASLQPQTPARRNISVSRAFSNESDLPIQMVLAQSPDLQKTLLPAWAQAASTPSSQLKSVAVFRLKVAPFGHNAPQRSKVVAIGNPVEYEEWKFMNSDSLTEKTRLHLDGQYNEIISGSWIVVEHAKTPVEQIILRVEATKVVSVSRFGLSARVTQLELSGDWYRGAQPNNTVDISLLRNATIYAQSENLPLAEEPISEDVQDETVELNDLFDGLKSGRWLMVSGERTDVTNTPGSDKVKANELVMLISAEQRTDPNLPGDTPHTTLRFANALAYKYKRETVTINANVAHATNGETRNHVLGSGDGARAFQEFKLSHSPLTYVSATTSSGIESTLEVRVNNVLWRESDQLSELKPNDRRYITRRDNEGNSFVIFGNGARGARLPTGVENIKALYRNGIGKAGNVVAEQISLLVTRPLGVKGVLNPQPATGGADPEDVNGARRNATVALKALDRAVSVQDYADFARAFAGIGKAVARRLSDGRRELVHLTIAGANDIPIAKNSDLYRNLQQALFRYGDPHQALQIDVRELLLIIISAKIKIFPEHLWEVVEPRLRATLLESFGFENRDLGQDVLRSEIISAIEAVEGVDYVDVDRLDALSQDRIVANLENLDSVIDANRPANRVVLADRVPVEFARLDRAQSDPDRRIRSAQLAYLSPAVPDTLILTEITS